MRSSIEAILVLVVDDDEMFRNAITSCLEQAGFAVVEAANGKAALELIGQKKFDVILSDVDMPYFSGIELVRHLKRTNIQIPIFLMTGGMSIDAEAAVALGAQDLFLKPFSDKMLQAALRKCVLETKSA